MYNHRFRIALPTLSTQAYGWRQSLGEWQTTILRHDGSFIRPQMEVLEAEAGHTVLYKKPYEISDLILVWLQQNKLVA